MKIAGLIVFQTKINQLTKMKLPYLFALIFILFYNCSNTEEDTPLETQKATLNSITISKIEANSVILLSSILDDGNSEIIEYGFVWSTNEDPTINDNFFTMSNGNSNEFSATILDLQPNIEYFVKAFAKNSVGIAYGDSTSFKTSHFIYDGHINLKSQSEIDEFGANGYTNITGTIFIGQLFVNSDISSLNSLAKLEIIGGGLNIQGYNPLTNLSGLENLTSVGAIYIQFSELTNLDELENLTSLDGGNSGGLTSFFSSNKNLTNIDGLKNLKSINSLLHIENNSLLTNLNGLSSLTSIGALRIENNENLNNLNGLSNLSSISNYLMIKSNSQLNSISELTNLKSIGQKCEIFDNPMLNDFCVFTSIFSDSDDFEFIISNNLYNPTKQNIIDGNCSS